MICLYKLHECVRVCVCVSVRVCVYVYVQMSKDREVAVPPNGNIGHFCVMVFIFWWYLYSFLVYTAFIFYDNMLSFYNTKQWNYSLNLEKETVFLSLSI